ncbi:hypothetical protein J7E70_07775 [Variovorax paradoxus]|nr:hypothetical protein [Variovorax paradoxus]MBT2300361.1 hypothetical protein [Variovorax paradoxus]
MNLVELEERDRKIDALEEGIRRELQPVVCPVVNHFAPGLYAREMHIPAGTVLTGKIHKYANLSIMSAGCLRIFLEDGTTSIVKAPFTYVSPPGTRRAAEALEDTVWTVIHATEETDVAKIEQQFIAQTPAEYRLFHEEQLKLGVDMTKEVQP